MKFSALFVLLACLFVAVSCSVPFAALLSTSYLGLRFLYSWNHSELPWLALGSMSHLLEVEL